MSKKRKKPRHEELFNWLVTIGAFCVDEGADLDATKRAALLIFAGAGEAGLSEVEFGERMNAVCDMIHEARVTVALCTLWSRREIDIIGLDDDGDILWSKPVEKDS